MILFGMGAGAPGEGSGGGGAAGGAGTQKEGGEVEGGEKKKFKNRASQLRAAGRGERGEKHSNGCPRLRAPGAPTFTFWTLINISSSRSPGSPGGCLCALIIWVHVTAGWCDGCFF